MPACASLSQPEAAFDYSAAAQIGGANPTDDDYTRLNARIRWQLTNKDRGLQYLPLDWAKMKVMVFTDGSFANNADLSSQLGWVIALVEEVDAVDESEASSFAITANIMHWSSTKCKRVTWSVLASEIYGMAGGFDLRFVTHATVMEIAKALAAAIPTTRKIPLVVCTDSYSLYECLVKLRTTEEKR